MSRAVLGVAVAAGEVRGVPKLALNMEEVCFCLGSTALVNELREIGVLVPAKRHGRVLLFDVTDVRVVWERYKAGTYDAQLKQRGGPRG